MNASTSSWLPIRRHLVHGAWNYTLLPYPAEGGEVDTPTGEQHGLAVRRQRVLTRG